MTTLYVNPQTGSDSAVGSQSAPFKTIARAIARTASGTTIHLSPGTYSAASGEKFPLEIPSGVKVIGNETNKGRGILIQGSGKFVSPTAASQNITILLATNSQLRGVTVTNLDSRGTGVWIESTSPTVANCTFTLCKGEGVFVAGNANPAILDNIFVENSAAGVIAAGTAKGAIRRNIFQKTGFGISLQAQSAPLIADNQILENRSGIVLAGESQPILRNNRIEKNTEDGLTAVDKSLPDIGTAQDLGGNIFQNNGELDLQNSTGVKISAVGNQLNPSRVKGLFDLGNVTTATPTPGGLKFSDISTHWAKDFIDRLAKMNIVSGFPNGTFQPYEIVTRAQYAAVLAKAFELVPRREATVFKDVAADFWAKGAIDQANRAGFLVGYPDSTFRPEQNLTRVQAIVSLVNGLQLAGGNPNSLSVYVDRAQIPSFATDEIATATERKIVVNYPAREKLSPAHDITRGEISALIYQTLVATKRAEPINSPYIV
ncbi:parallel beta-helix repeat protein [Oscillatoria nigro-viridis PCC 7112]|uniref:Parallel beta-helix repeat protein n=2 Tax=Phormidium nigroviride TaxID=482564 RepID=K9VET3_9CYAN|nr:DUF1565 domain-containing protein [Oscillatoria nigro-viridis]AFZ06009.1 parallel beta-helix repeat protein [Oscillatoria nigro-viridis PCC 7112]